MYISLDSVIKDYQIESEQSNNSTFKLFHLAYRGLEEMGLDFFYKIQSVKIPVNPNKTVTLPANYLNWTKVGILNERGEIIPLYYNDKLTTFADIWPDRLEVTKDGGTYVQQNDWGLNSWWNYWNGYAYTNIYGVPSGMPFVGNFKIDNANGVILLNHDFNHDYVMLEYVASPTEGEEYYLPVQFREALIAWLAWKDSKAKTIKSHMQLGSNRDLRSNYFNERRNAIARWKPTRIYDMYQVSQEQTRLAVKS